MHRYARDDFGSAIRRAVAQLIERLCVVYVGDDDIDVVTASSQSLGEPLGVALGAAYRRQVGVGGEGDAQRCQLGGHW